jgi:ribosomal protein S15P/S13E
MSFHEQLSKDKLLVELEKTSGKVVYGYLYTVRNSRPQDTFNDNRDFLPFQYLDGHDALIAKSTVAEVFGIVNVSAMAAAHGPYAAFGVSRDDSMEAIEAVYRNYILRCHPDNYKGDQYPDALRKVLSKVIMQVREHFEHIKKDQAKRTGVISAANG